MTATTAMPTLPSSKLSDGTDAKTRALEWAHQIRYWLRYHQEPHLAGNLAIVGGCELCNGLRAGGGSIYLPVWEGLKDDPVIAAMVHHIKTNHPVWLSLKFDGAQARVKTGPFLEIRDGLLNPRLIRLAGFH